MSARHCPICGDELPSTAHRNKKLCGKSRCMKEQALRSGRASYHRLLGHTEHPPKNCMICGEDITDLPTNARTCKNPECIEERKRRTKQEYYKRNLNNPEHQERLRQNQANYRQRHHKNRYCQICKEDISALAPGTKICAKQSCREYRERLRAQKGQRIRPTKAVKPPSQSRPLRKPARIRTTKIKRPVPRPRIPDDATPWIPTVRGLPEAAKTNNITTPIQYVASFEDPWDCAACRGRGALCQLHQSMTNNGYRSSQRVLDAV